MARTIEAPIADHLDATGAPRCRRLFSIQQAADHAGVRPAVILHWIRIGWLRAYRLPNGRIRIDQVELDECLASLEWLPCQQRADDDTPNEDPDEVSRHRRPRGQRR